MLILIWTTSSLQGNFGLNQNLCKSQQNSKFVTLEIKVAYDCVNHKLLIFKLRLNVHLHDSSSRLAAHYLENRVRTIKANRKLPQPKSIMTGIPQGSVLGPLLFIAFINNLMKSPNCYLFADDCLLLNYRPDHVSSAILMEKSYWYDNN